MGNLISRRRSETMQLADEAVTIAIDAGLQEYFVYHEWMRSRDIPKWETHVRIDSSVRAIRDIAFYNCRRHLRIVILNEDLEQIGNWALKDCISLKEIVIPNKVRRIKWATFGGCSGLTSVTLGDGLEEIGRSAFWHCMSLEEIVIPDNVRTIDETAFYKCTRLTRVTLRDGLEKIGEQAFSYCESLKKIVIPSTVKDIHDSAFKGCTNLKRVKFSDEIENFVTCDAMREWWNRGVGKNPLRTYCFMVRCGIPARFKGLSKISSWQATIHDLLRIIPTITVVNVEDDDDVINKEGLNAHFYTIDAKLAMYENLLYEAPTLFPDRLGLDEGIILTILSYL